MLSIDETDKSIIELLVSDATTTNKAIAKQLNLSERTIAKRIKRLTATGAMRVTLMWDLASLGLNFGAYVYLTTQGSSIKETVSCLKRIPEVTSINQMAGRSTIGVQIYTSTSAHFIEVISQKIAQIKNVEITCSDSYLKIFKLQLARGVHMEVTPWLPAHIQQDELKNIDAFDIALFDTTKMDARMSVRDIASHLKVSETKVKYRLKKLRAAHVIKPSTVVDYKVFGYNAAAIIRLRVSAADLMKTAAALANHDNIAIIALVSGEYNLFMSYFGSNSDTISEEIQCSILSRKGVIAYEIFPVLNNFHLCYNLTQLG